MACQRKKSAILEIYLAYDLACPNRRVYTTITTILDVITAITCTISRNLSHSLLRSLHTSYRQWCYKQRKNHNEQLITLLNVTIILSCVVDGCSLEENWCLWCYGVNGVDFMCVEVVRLFRWNSQSFSARCVRNGLVESWTTFQRHSKYRVIIRAERYSSAES